MTRAAAPLQSAAPTSSGRLAIGAMRLRVRHGQGQLPPRMPDGTALAKAMREALPVFGRKIRGYDMPDAVMTGVETRTSSPIRITRGKDCQSLNTRGLYPAGEGAGYAGGILSAAVDGIRVAEALAEAGTALRLFGKPYVEGSRRVAVALARDVSLEAAREKARRVAAALKVDLV